MFLLMGFKFFVVTVLSLLGSMIAVCMFYVENSLPFVLIEVGWLNVAAVLLLLLLALNAEIVIGHYVPLRERLLFDSFNLFGLR